MNDVARAVQGLLNRPTATGLVAALGVAGALLLVGLVLLLATRRRWVGVGLGAAGLVLAVAALAIVDHQTITIRESESVTVTRPRYRERTRSLARGAMIALPAAAVLAGLGAWASARRQLKRSIPGLVKAGRMHLFLKEYEPALALFHRAIRISPYLADAYWGRGAAYQGLGDVDKALADYNQAIQYDPRCCHAYLQRARIRTDSGDIEGALADLARVLELQPNDPELYLTRGICFLNKGLLAEASVDFQRVLKLTNHSDYAEPAKAYLHQVDLRAAGLPFTPPAGLPGANGVPGSAAAPEPRARDHSI